MFPGDSFGELALTQDIPRKVTVIAEQKSRLITLSQEAFLQIISNLDQYQVSGTADFFYNLPLFHYCQRSQLEEIAKRCQYKKFPTNTLILRQEDLPTSLFFIKSGRIKVLRKVEFKIPQNRKEVFDVDFLIQDPVLEDYEQHNVESKLLEIDELTSGDCFADYAAILKESIKYSVITIIPTEVFILQITDFMSILKEKFAEAFLNFSKVTP